MIRGTRKATALIALVFALGLLLPAAAAADEIGVPDSSLPPAEQAARGQAIEPASAEPQDETGQPNEGDADDEEGSAPSGDFQTENERGDGSGAAPDDIEEPEADTPDSGELDKEETPSDDIPLSPAAPPEGDEGGDPDPDPSDPEDETPRNCWEYVGVKTYYRDANGNRVIYTQVIDGKTYYFNSAGVMYTGWLTWSNDKTRSFFGSDGAAVSGWCNDGSKTYYISPTTLRTVRYSNNIVVNGKQHLFYFSSAGVMHTGWLTWNDGRRSFFAQNANYIPTGAAFSKWVTTSGNKYYFSTSDYRAYRYSQTVDGKAYYFNGAGVMQTGIIKFGNGTVSLYASNGPKVTNGWATIGNDTYYVRNSTPVTYSQTIDGSKYYFSGNYKMHRGWLFFSSTGKWKYYDEKTGKETEPKVGWSITDGKYYFYSPDGKLTTWVRSVYESWNRIKNLTSNTRYLGAVDQDRTYTTFFIRQGNVWVPYIGWTCSVGSSASPTPKGTFKTGNKQEYTEIHEGEHGVWYWTCFNPNDDFGTSFHSVLTDPGRSKNIRWQGLGLHNSGGCVRCPMDKAKWVYDNIYRGTTVHIY